MRRTKIDYGIDLGTTNSAIARIDHGTIRVFRPDRNNEILPSCVSVASRTKKNSKENTLRFYCGEQAVSQLERDNRMALREGMETSSVFREFKRMMGTDAKYEIGSDHDPLSPEFLSGEIVKKLIATVTDDSPRAVVITIPAKFTINQKEATVRAAELAGIVDCRLLQEPIAAAMAYGINQAADKAWWIVFDFGGGTFDAAILQVEEGITSVRDTEGDNYLGGKDLDLAIVDEILIPYLAEKYSISGLLADPKRNEQFRNLLKIYAEKAKMELSFTERYDLLTEPDELTTDDDGNEMEIDLSLTRTDLEKVLRPIFQRAIDITKTLISRNKLSGESIDTLILVGGPTLPPLVRQMLREQITENVDTSVDPLTVVAKGAALYASTLEPNITTPILGDAVAIQLQLQYESITVDDSDLVTVRVDQENSTSLPDGGLVLEIERADTGWSSGRVGLDSKGQVIELDLIKGRQNLFSVTIFDNGGNKLECEPNQFTITHGTKPAKATLGYSIGIGIQSTKKRYPIVRTIPGLEKNRSQPAVGFSKGLRTQSPIRPGIADDELRVPIYEVEDGQDGTRLINNQFVCDAVVTGEHFGTLIPAESEVEITVSMNQDRINVKAFFPANDETVEMEPQAARTQVMAARWLRSELGKLQKILGRLEGDIDDELEDQLRKEISVIERDLENGSVTDDGREQIRHMLRRLFARLDDIEDSVVWPKVKGRLQEEFYELEEIYARAKDSADLNQRAVKAAMDQFREQIPDAIKIEDVESAEHILDEIGRLRFAMLDSVMGIQLDIGILNQFADEFDDFHWNDRSKARLLVNQGLRMVAEGTTKKSLRPLLRELVHMLPDTDAARFEQDLSLLRE